MEVPRLRIELELQPPAYTTATAMQNPSCVCDLHHSSWPQWILNPLNKAMDQTQNLMVTSRVLLPLYHDGSSGNLYFNNGPKCFLGSRMIRVELLWGEVDVKKKDDDTA